MSKAKWYQKPLYTLVALALVLSLGIVAMPTAGTVEASPGDVSGDITVDTTWSTDMNFTADVTVASGVTLTIEPGVTVTMNGFSLIVNGVLDARGTEGNMITFSSNPHIKLSGSGSNNSILSYCDISSVFNWPLIEFDDSDATVEHSNIEYTSQQSHRAVVKVRNGASPTIQYSTIKGDSSDLFSGFKITDAYEILVDDEVPDGVGCNPTIIGNTIDGDANVNGDTSESGILMTNGNDAADVSTATITGNTIKNHRDSGSPGPHGAYAGIEIREGCSATISGNTIDNNIHGIFLEGSTPLGVYSTATIEGNTIKNGDYGIYAVLLNTPLTAHYNNIYGNALYGVFMFTPSMDAENNWWGDASGPYNADSNPTGTGDAVSDNVDYMPWYATSTTTPDREWVEVTFSPDVRAYSDTIQGGIDAAQAGDTINVAAGTYTENVVIDKALILQGDGSYPTIHDDGDRPIYIKASSVTVKGFTIVDTTGKGGAVYLCSTPVSQVTIEDNRITQAWVGVWINPGTFDYITIKGNIMSGITHRGIMIMATVIHLNIEGNEIAGAIDAVDNSSGIYMQSVTGSVVTDNTIVGNNISGFTKSTGRCITGSNNDHVTISNNILTGSGQDILTLWGGGTLHDILIEGNIIKNAGRHGIALAGGANIQVLSNTVTGSTKIGIRVKSDSTDDAININYNNIEDSGEYGLKNERGACKIVDATNNWWGDASGPHDPYGSVEVPPCTDDPTTEINADGTGDKVSDNVDYCPWLISSWPYVEFAQFTIDHAKIDFKKKADDDKVRVKGKLELDLDCGDDVNILEDVTVTVGSFSETIPGDTMVEKKSGKWEYKRPKGESGIKHMKIHWKDGEAKFDIRVDKADLGEMSDWTNPVTISVRIGDDVGEEPIWMREKKHHWDYKAHGH